LIQHQNDAVYYAGQCTEHDHRPGRVAASSFPLASACGEGSLFSLRLLLPTEPAPLRALGFGGAPRHRVRAVY